MNPKTARLLSNMGERTSARTGRRTFYAGMDIGSREGAGALITAVKAGTIEHVLADDDARRAFRGYGNGVIVDHGDGTWALYAHMQQTAPGLAPGMRVEPGTPLGYMGNTTNGAFRMPVPHLHLELRRAKRDGSSPFPGPYRTYNLDPADWLSELGMRFVRRGGLEIDVDSPIDLARPQWQAVHPYTGAPGVAGLGRAVPIGPPGMIPVPTRRGLYYAPDTRANRRRRRAGLGLGSLGQKPGALPGQSAPVPFASKGSAVSKPGVPFDFTVTNTYEPVRMDRDVLFGLTPVAWGLIAVGLSAAVGGTVWVLTKRRR
jgi:hypothetical protein